MFVASLTRITPEEPQIIVRRPKVHYTPVYYTYQW